MGGLEFLSYHTRLAATQVIRRLKEFL